MTQNHSLTSIKKLLTRATIVVIFCALTISSTISTSVYAKTNNTTISDWFSSPEIYTDPADSLVGGRNDATGTVAGSRALDPLDRFAKYDQKKCPKYDPNNPNPYLTCTSSIFSEYDTTNGNGYWQDMNRYTRGEVNPQTAQNTLNKSKSKCAGGDVKCNYLAQSQWLVSTADEQLRENTATPQPQDNCFLGCVGASSGNTTIDQQLDQYYNYSDTTNYKSKPSTKKKTNFLAPAESSQDNELYEDLDDLFGFTSSNESSNVAYNPSNGDYENTISSNIWSEETVDTSDYFATTYQESQNYIAFGDSFDAM